MIKTLMGGVAVSDGQASKLAKEFSASKISARYIYFVEVSRNVGKNQTQKLLELLPGAGSGGELVKGQSFIVIPRKGTISPWSSKASDIAKNAGLDFVKRIERGIIYVCDGLSSRSITELSDKLHDRMTESVVYDISETTTMFDQQRARPLLTVDINKGSKAALVKANTEYGFALSGDEIEYLHQAYSELGRSPTDAELMMFAQINSEHCRHKIFNAEWVVDGKKQPKSLFKMIKNTYENSSSDVLSAYSDNAAVLRGPHVSQFRPDPKNNVYCFSDVADNMVIKVETHNHPTAIAPFPGAATGTGGEIRDEGATGRGARSKMGLAGYSVSNLNIPNYIQPWEKNYGKPDTIASPLSIMIEAPLGAAAFANEFGRPNLLGYFRTFEQLSGQDVWGYHKPIMVAGGVGTIGESNVEKRSLYPGAQLVVLGGPAMLIGLGGSAASSMQTGDSDESLDFASVQRENPEMQRRAQEVISTLATLGKDNPIVSIHDVGAGGLSNAFPELVNDSNLGAVFDLRKIPSDDSSLSPMEIWCNESQERYVLGIDKKDLLKLEKICNRERCPFAVVGEATKERRLILKDSLIGNTPVDMPMDVLFGKPPKMVREVVSAKVSKPRAINSNLDIKESIERVLKLPSVGSKKFLITIGDRNVGGLTARDQMIGRWQVPVSDVAVTAGSFKDKSGQAMSIGERATIALSNAEAAARMTVGEAITNIVSADIVNIKDIKLSANWMAAVGFKHEDEKLYKAVRALGEDFCTTLGITIPVGKDSLSMRSRWQDKDGTEKSVTSPISLVITAFSPVEDVEKTITPELDARQDTRLILVDLSAGKQCLGGSAFHQVQNIVSNETPDIEASVLSGYFEVIKKLKKKNKILAYHDRSDGGLLATLLEMAFTARAGLSIDLSELPGETTQKLFNEELGAVLQIRKADEAKVLKELNSILPGTSFMIGTLSKDEQIVFKEGNSVIYKNTRAALEEIWSQTSYQVQKLRDNPRSADQEFSLISDNDHTGLFAKKEPKLLEYKYTKILPKVAIFRDEGINGQIEMAAALDEAGFQAVDIHLNDLKKNPTLLEGFNGLVACGGFSYGDVLGAGNGWAKSILYNPELKNALKNYFERKDTFSLGVCNGCQMLSSLKEIIPGADDWPEFVKNDSQRFEARLTMVEVLSSPSVLLKGMSGAILPIPVAHGEGRIDFLQTQNRENANSKLAALRYVDSGCKATQKYPLNPNGSLAGNTAYCSTDGKVTIMMPHPERAFLNRQMSWRPEDWVEEYTPWFRMFQNARLWVEEQN